MELPPCEDTLARWRSSGRALGVVVRAKRHGIYRKLIRVWVQEYEAGPVREFLSDLTVEPQ